MQTIIQMLHLKTVRHFLHARQKLMTFLLMKEIIFIFICHIYIMLKYKVPLVGKTADAVNDTIAL